MTNILVLSADLNKDVDDVWAFTLAAGLRKKGLARFLGVLCDRGPALLRTRQTRGVLNALGCNDVEVACGSDYSPDKGPDTPLCNQWTEGIGNEFPKGIDWLMKQFQSAAPQSITGVAISGLYDLAAVLRTPQGRSAVQKALKEVIFMGGAAIEDGYLWSDDRASNNAFDPSGAAFVYATLQRLGIPTITVTRHAAAAAAVTGEFYASIGDGGSDHPVAVFQKEYQGQALQKVWFQVHQPVGSPARENFNPQLGPEWFRKFFFGSAEAGAGLGPNDPIDSVMGLVRKWTLYDAVTMMFAVPSIREEHTTPERVVVDGVEHLVIGISPEKPGLVNGSATRDFMVQMIGEGLTN